MKLTKNQIDELYKFTRKHYVYHYDVQSELVDHLANDIEKIWEQTPNLSFEDAKNNSFKKFGIFGFMDVIEAKQKQMNKRYKHIMWRFFKEWFTLPKVTTTIVLFLSIFFFLKIQFSEYILLGTLFIFLIFDVINQFKNIEELYTEETGDHLDELSRNINLISYFIAAMFIAIVFIMSYAPILLMANATLERH
jgi:hypothetical protein